MLRLFNSNSGLINQEINFSKTQETTLIMTVWQEDMKIIIEMGKIIGEMTTGIGNLSYEEILIRIEIGKILILPMNQFIIMMK